MRRRAFITLVGGAAFVQCSGWAGHKGDLAAINFPLPPITEQHRIVAKVDELMALCDRLETAQAEREATRDRLAAACLARLNEPDPETFRDDARFALNNLAALTTRSDQISQLRQMILNLAVRGKLVRQDPKDEPASELLYRRKIARPSYVVGMGECWSGCRSTSRQDARQDKEQRNAAPLPPQCQCEMVRLRFV